MNDRKPSASSSWSTNSYRPRIGQHCRDGMMIRAVLSHPAGRANAAPIAHPAADSGAMIENLLRWRSQQSPRPEPSTARDVPPADAAERSAPHATTRASDAPAHLPTGAFALDEEIEAFALHPHPDAVYAPATNAGDGPESPRRIAPQRRLLDG